MPRAPPSSWLRLSSRRFSRAMWCPRQRPSAVRRACLFRLPNHLAFWLRCYKVTKPRSNTSQTKPGISVSCRRPGGRPCGTKWIMSAAAQREPLLPSDQRSSSARRSRARPSLSSLIRPFRAGFSLHGRLHGRVGGTPCGGQASGSAAAVNQRPFFFFTRGSPSARPASIAMPAIVPVGYTGTASPSR